MMHSLSYHGRKFNMPTTRVNAILYLTKTFFDFYAVGMSNTLRYTFSAETIRNLDIVTPDDLVQQIHIFTSANKLPSSNILMLLSDDLLFCKEFPMSSGVNLTHEDEIRNFLDAVPFDHVLNKLYKLEKREILVATNLDYFTKFQEAFKNNESRIEEVVPIFLLGKTINLDNGMPQEVAHVILDKLGTIRPWSMPIMQNILTPVVQDTSPIKKNHDQVDADIPIPPPSSSKKTNTRTLLLIAGFVPLLGIFLYLFFQMNAENAKQEALFRAKQETTQSQPTLVPTIANSDTSDQSTSAFSATVDEQNLKVSIEYSQLSASLAASMKTELTNFGIKTIQDIPESTGSSENTVLFSNTVTEATKQRIVNELHNVTANIQVQDNSQISSDILITLP